MVCHSQQGQVLVETVVSLVVLLTLLALITNTHQKMNDDLHLKRRQHYKENR